MKVKHAAMGCGAILIVALFAVVLIGVFITQNGVAGAYSVKDGLYHGVLDSYEERQNGTLMLWVSNRIDTVFCVPHPSAEQRNTLKSFVQNATVLNIEYQSINNSLSEVQIAGGLLGGCDREEGNSADIVVVYRPIAYTIFEPNFDIVNPRTPLK